LQDTLHSYIVRNYIDAHQKGVYNHCWQWINTPGWRVNYTVGQRGTILSEAMAMMEAEIKLFLKTQPKKFRSIDSEWEIS
jgi:hypothetical protein